MERTEESGSSRGTDAPAGERYLLLADISGYTRFMAGVEQVHGVDLRRGHPGRLLHARGPPRHHHRGRGA